MVNPKRKPKFLKQGSNYLKKVKKRWRKPKGVDSKLRFRHKSKGKMPEPGYGAPKDVKGLHPSGFKEFMIQNINDLDKIDPKTHAGRISSKIGKRKKLMILEKAEKMKIKILNP